MLLSHQYLRDPNLGVTDGSSLERDRSTKDVHCQTLPLMIGSVSLSMAADSATRQYKWNIPAATSVDMGLNDLKTMAFY